MTDKNSAPATIIVTGASGNLGLVVTKLFLEKGYRVIATVTNELARSFSPANDLLEVHVVDLANESQTADFIALVLQKHGQIDAALMLAGGFAMGNVDATSSSDIEKQYTLNFLTAYHVARPLLQHMLDNNKGRLVFIGARPALHAADGKNLVAYALSKSLLFKLAELINAEAKGKNITASVVIPSTIDTALNRQNMPDADPAAWVRPEQIAEALEFICSKSGSAFREVVLKVYNNA